VIDENGAFLGILTEQDLAPEISLVNLETVVTDFSSGRALPQNVQMVY